MNDDRTRPTCPAVVDVVMHTRRYCPETGLPRGRGVSRPERVRCFHDPDHGGLTGAAALHAGDSTWGRVLWASSEDRVELEQERPYRGRHRKTGPPLPLLAHLEAVRDV